MKAQNREEYRAKQIRQTAQRRRKLLKTRVTCGQKFVSLGLGPWNLGMTRKVTT